MSTSRAMLISLTAAALGAIAIPALAEERLTGTWTTGDGSTRVRFGPCGAADCGEIVWLREPKDPETGEPWRDKLNGDDALKRRPLLGLSMISNLKLDGPHAWSGTLYNPLDGNSYTGRFLMLDAAKLQLKGCTLAGLLCQTETWLRAED